MRRRCGESSDSHYGGEKCNWDRTSVKCRPSYSNLYSWVEREYRVLQDLDCNCSTGFGHKLTLLPHFVPLPQLIYARAHKGRWLEENNTVTDSHSQVSIGPTLRGEEYDTTLIHPLNHKQRGWGPKTRDPAPEPGGTLESAASHVLSRFA